MSVQSTIYKTNKDMLRLICYSPKEKQPSRSNPTKTNPRPSRGTVKTHKTSQEQKEPTAQAKQTKNNPHLWQEDNRLLVGIQEL